MSIAPSILGCPLWFGRIKSRTAKKHLCHDIFRDSKFLASMAEYQEGDLICDCSAFNVRIARIEPRYRRLAGEHGQILVDIDITNDRGGGCSFAHCGVEPARSREDILQHWEESVAYYKENGDRWNFAKRYEFTTIDKDGIATVDYAGLKAKYGIV
jgi:hypothetical protein